MTFYSVRKTFKYFLGIIVLMAVVIFHTSFPKRVLVAKDTNLRLQNSTATQTTGAMFDSQNATLQDFDVEKIQIVFHQMDDILSQEKDAIISFFSEPIINIHSFEYFHNPKNTCTDSTDILIVVPSAPGNFEKRKKFRQGEYLKFLNITENRTKLLFFIGLTRENKTQSLIDEELNAYKDIVQEFYEDIYQNIRYKAVSMLKWASTFCPYAKYVIRNDDDISVNLTSVITTVRRTGMQYSNFILGRLRINDKPDRAEIHKNYLSYREYPETYFPPYALGGLLGYPILTVELLYEAALRVKPIWLDDVYITGICGQKVGVKLLTDHVFNFKHTP